MMWMTKIRLLLCGWRPRRDVWGSLLLPEGIEPFAAARCVLGEFGGLSFDNANDLTVLEPIAASGEVEAILRFGEMIGIRLYPIGVTRHQDDEFWLVDENGTIYIMTSGPVAASEVYELRPVAGSIWSVLHRFMLRKGKRGRCERELRAMGLWGKRWEMEMALRLR